ncbi:polysaccharide biosynthesis tyrosine autokinase [Hymenobacter terricola]|uniref:polysaccharide biosynthesis tyrosine autokinase n=1 Tax=Hymenobacter terricola TaxID=2819236 RepID=UPI001B30D5E2|nr:tyrosine-protein kinase family protein [Hymenobacter terricola]
MNSTPSPTSTPVSDEIDLNALFFRLRHRWPLFVGGLALAALLAYVYLQVSPPVYAFHATMLLGDQTSGSRKAQELLQMLEVRDKGMKMEDEIGLITSSGMVRQAVSRLPYAVSYYAVPNTWLNQFRPLQVREQPAGALPFRVAPNWAVPQLTGVRLFVTPAGPGRYRVQAKASKGQLNKLGSGELVRDVQDVDIDETVAAGDTLRTPLVCVVLTPEPGAKFEANGTKYFFKLNGLGDAMGRYAGTLAVKPIDHESRIVELQVKSSVPGQATAFLDTLMAVYATNDLHEKNVTGQKTLAFLDDKIGKLAGTRRQAAGALATFRSTRGVVDVGAQSSSGIQQLSTLETAQARAITSRKYCQNMLNYLRDNQGIDQLISPSSVGIENSVLDNLILQLHQMNTHRAELGVNASAINPAVKKLDETIRATKQSLAQLLTNMNQAAEIGLRDVNSQLAQVRNQISQMPENERQLAALKSANDFNDKNYTFLEEKRNEAAIALATNASDKHVVDSAQMAGSGPEAPKPLLVALLALLAGLGVPTGLGLLLERANRRVQRPEDLASITTIPMLGMVAHGTKDDAELNNPKGALAESFRSIRINLQYLSDGRNKKIIGVTSSVPGEGKTFCAVNLASELAASGRRVLLLECDLRRPTVANYFGSPQGPGLSAYLSGEASLNEAMSASGVDNLDVVCCGAIPPNPMVLLESRAMDALVEQMRAEYDYVVLDTPPMGYVAEFFVLLRHFDASLYIVRQNYTAKDMLSQIDELYRANKVSNIYTVLNDVNFAKTYGYSHKANAYAYGYSR